LKFKTHGKQLETTNANLNSKTYGLESANGLFWKLLDLAATSANLKELKKSHSKHLFCASTTSFSAKTAFLPLFLFFSLSNWKQTKLSRTNIKLHLHEASNIAPLGETKDSLAFPSTLGYWWRTIF